MRFFPVYYTDGRAGVVRVSCEGFAPFTGKALRCDDGEIRIIQEIPQSTPWQTFNGAATFCVRLYCVDFDVLAIATMPI